AVTVGAFSHRSPAPRRTVVVVSFVGVDAPRPGYRLAGGGIASVYTFARMRLRQYGKERAAVYGQCNGDKENEGSRQSATAAQARETIRSWHNFTAKECNTPSQLVGWCRLQIEDIPRRGWH